MICWISFSSFSSFMRKTLSTVLTTTMSINSITVSMSGAIRVDQRVPDDEEVKTEHQGLDEVLLDA